MKQSLRVRFDFDTRSQLETRLLGALQEYEVATQAALRLKDELDVLASVIDGAVEDAALGSSRLRMFFAARRRRAAGREGLARLAALMESSGTRKLESRIKELHHVIAFARIDKRELWDDYRKRAVAYNGLLAAVSGLAPDQSAARGFIPADLASAVNAQPLDMSLLSVSLRGYQAFGAKFALLQRKAILGDEMGLGKTVEALAVMSHLHKEGKQHFLVVCPASVLVNWAHEVERHSSLRSHRLHGPDRASSHSQWAHQGGVALTAYRTLQSLRTLEHGRIELLVIDEAHYVKNPTAQRTRAVRDLCRTVERVLFLTGTPLENRVDEFRTLVDHIRPDVAGRIDPMAVLAGPASFRRAVAPVYLRRNQSDVLEELPERIETQDWVELSAGDLGAYRQAVASGNFMLMRRAAFAPGTVAGSAKLARLSEIVDEAAANERKAVIFSFFREVLDTITRVLNVRTIGPITGSVSPTERQRLVDQFTELRDPAVLVSQIEAGGVGMNMQAASVVILTEPQWKPSTENQAIARCHRMGQVQRVEVHRLLAENSVDQRMLAVVAAKSQLFDMHARRSALKESSSDAIDASDLGAVRELASQMEAERQIIEIERKRLGFN